MAVYTFVCLARKQVAGAIDIQDLPGGDYRQHALGLLREHASAAAVEVWQDDEMLETIDRGPAPPRPEAPSPSVSTDPSR